MLGGFTLASSSRKSNWCAETLMCPPARKIPHGSANSLCLSGFQIQSGWQPRWVITQFLLRHLLAIQPRKRHLHWSKWLPENMLTFLSCLIASARSSSAFSGPTFYSGLCETYLYRLMYLDTLPLAGSAVWGGYGKFRVESIAVGIV